MKKEMVCISCPLSCRLTAVLGKGAPGMENIVVSGNKCPKGADYAREEMLAPRRVVTATVKTLSSEHPRLPVKTTAAVPRESIPALLLKLKSLTVSLPAAAGTVVLEDTGIPGVKVTATRTME
ncbi:MAG: DUF1667 domain-containing protein [Spirochaetales bacterium]|nr:MAG: DUF1667 domain-containing protein [Spirochaetales bacterium]